jgi:hypothetical protein
VELKCVQKSGRLWRKHRATWWIMCHKIDWSWTWISCPETRKRLGGDLAIEELSGSR